MEYILLLFRLNLVVCEILYVKVLNFGAIFQYEKGAKTKIVFSKLVLKKKLRGVLFMTFYRKIKNATNRHFF